MHFKNDMKNLPQTEWIELRQKQKKKLERATIEREKEGKKEKVDSEWKRWNKIFVDDVSIVYTVMHRMWNGEKDIANRGKRNKNDYCLTSEGKRGRNQIVETNRATHLITFCFIASSSSLQMFAFEIKIKGFKEGKKGERMFKLTHR